MSSIHKYILNPGFKQNITASIIRPLSVQRQDVQTCLWATVDENCEPRNWTVYSVGTGNEVETGRVPFGAHYLGTVQYDFGNIVYHYFICEE